MGWRRWQSLCCYGPQAKYLSYCSPGVMDQQLSPLGIEDPASSPVLLLAARRENPANVQRIHSCAARFHNGWSQQSEEGALHQQPVCP